MEANKKRGLVMEGGAMRGLFSAGVIDILMENDIWLDGMIGVSAGAVFGCNYKSGQIGRVIRYNTRFCKDPRFCSFRSLIKTGDLYGGDFCYRELPDELDIFDRKAFAESDMEFYLVCTDIKTGRPAYHKCVNGDDEDLQWMRASASMPFVSRITEKEGKYLLDGGLADPIPLKYLQSRGYEKNIVILTRPRGYQKRKSKTQFFTNALLLKYPRLIETLKARPLVYNSTLRYIAHEEKLKKVLVIAPPYPLPTGKIEHNPDRMKVAYNIGRNTAKAMLNEINEFIKND